LDTSRTACLEFATMSPNSLSSRDRNVVIKECIRYKKKVVTKFRANQSVDPVLRWGIQGTHTHTHTHTHTESMVISQIYIVPLKEEQ